MAMQKRYLCAPRLATELTGKAKCFIVGKRPDWVSYNGRVVKLLSHLKSSLGLFQLPDGRISDQVLSNRVVVDMNISQGRLEELILSSEVEILDRTMLLRLPLAIHGLRQPVKKRASMRLEIP